MQERIQKIISQCGIASRRRAEEMIQEGLVTVNGVSLNAELVRGGYAWVYGRYCKKAFCADWKGLEAQAKAVGAGLWADRNPQAPWDWRRER